MKKTAKDLSQMANDLGIKMANIHAVKITIETAERQKVVLDPEKYTASVMKGLGEYGISF